MALAIFDLDNTLLSGDSDYLWGKFLLSKNLVDPTWYEAENNRFFKDYKAGELNINEWLSFQIKPLTEIKTKELFSLRDEFIANSIKPLILRKGLSEIEQQRKLNHTLLIITATNNFITRPIADLLGIQHLLATELEFKNDCYTGKVIGEPTYQTGKVTRLKRWLLEYNLELTNSKFYSDSHNDIPLLDIVDIPIAVDPDAKLEKYAMDNNWQIVSFR